MIWYNYKQLKKKLGEYIMQVILFVGLGGGLGAISRYLISLATLKWWSDSFPLGAPY